MAVAFAPVISAVAGEVLGGDEEGGGMLDGAGIGKKFEQGADVINKKQDERNKKAEARQIAAANAAALEKDQGWADATNELAATYAEGPSSAELVSPELLVNTSTDAIGGEALRTMAMQGQGYNPAMAFNPFIQSNPALARAEDAHAAHAGRVADQTMSDWEASMQGLQDEYGSALDAVGDERERRAGAFRDEVEGWRKTATLWTRNLWCSSGWSPRRPAPAKVASTTASADAAVPRTRRSKSW